VRKCFVCGEELEGPEDAEKEYLYNSGLCSLECKQKYQTKRREKYKNEGKCPNCGNQVNGYNVYCQDCLEKEKERYERYKREGKCPICGEDLPDDGRGWNNNILCPECAEKQRNYQFHGEHASREELLYGKSEE